MAFRFASAAGILGTVVGASPVWPPPMTLRQSGLPAMVSTGLSFDIVDQSNGLLGVVEASRLSEAADRATALLQQRAAAGRRVQSSSAPTLSSVEIRVDGPSSAEGDGILGIETDYSYGLEVDAVAGKAVVTAPSSAQTLSLVCCAIDSAAVCPRLHVSYYCGVSCTVGWVVVFFIIIIGSLWCNVRIGVARAAC